MKWSLLNQPLGLSCPVGCPTRKEIAWFVPLIASAVISAASTGAGAAASKNANDRARDRLNGEKAVTEAERRKNKYQAWTDTINGMNTLRKIQENAYDEITRISGSAKVGGSTAAQVAAEKDALRKREAEIIAEGAARHEDNVDVKDASYRQELSGINQQLINNDLQQGLNTAQAAAAVGNTIANAGAAMAMGSPGGGGVSTGTGTTGGTLLQQMNTPVKTTTPVTPEMQMAQGMQHYLGGYNNNYNALLKNPNFMKWVINGY